MIHNKLKKMDSKELDLPETTFVRDIESKVYQSIALECLAKIEGITLPEGNLFDSILGRDPHERIKGIHVEQDPKHRSVKLRIEINVIYGVSIPEKCEEIQCKVSEEVTNLTGIHVSSVHVIFKNLVSKESVESQAQSEQLEEQLEEIIAEEVPSLED